MFRNLFQQFSVCTLLLLTTLGVKAEIPDPTRPPIELNAVPLSIAQPNKRIAISTEPEFTLQSIMMSQSRKFAVINGITVNVGDTIKGAKVMAIEPNCVNLNQKGKSIQLKMLHVEVKQSVAASGSLE